MLKQSVDGKYQAHEEHVKGAIPVRKSRGDVLCRLYARAEALPRRLEGQSSPRRRTLSGGYGQDELEGAGAFRVYEEPAGSLNHLDDVGVRSLTD
jgi:hypothetical protein